MRQFIAVLAVAVTITAVSQFSVAHRAHADVDMTGQWRLDTYYPPGQFFNTRQVTFVQVGPSLSMTDGSLTFTGSFNATANTFAITLYDFGIQQIRGNVSSNGDSFTGTWTVPGLTAGVIGEHKQPITDTPTPTVTPTPTQTPQAVGGVALDPRHEGRTQPVLSIATIIAPLCAVAFLAWLARRRLA